MQKNKIILATLFLGGSLHARTSSSEFLNDGFGAKSAGLGNAYGVVVSDPSALYWNPAGLAQIYNEKKITQTVETPKNTEKPAGDDEEFNKLLEDQNTGGTKDTKTEEISVKGTQYQINTTGSYLSNGRMLYFGGVGMTLGSGGIGVGYAGSRVGSVNTYDSNGTSTGSSAYMAHAGFIGYGISSGFFRFGASLVGIREDVVGGAVNGGGINAGVQTLPFLTLVSFAADLKNLAAIQNRSGGGVKDIGKLDTLFSFSMQVQAPPPNSNFKIILGFTANLDKPEGDGVKLNMGLAYGFNKYFYAMLGINGSKPAVGLGANVGKTLHAAVSVNRDPLGREFQYFGELNFAF